VLVIFDGLAWLYASGVPGFFRSPTFFYSEYHFEVPGFFDVQQAVDKVISEDDSCSFVIPAKAGIQEKRGVRETSGFRPSPE